MFTLSRALRRGGRYVIDGVLVVFVVGSLSFVLVRLAPGDPVTATLSDARVSPTARAQWRAWYGLDESMGAQYATYVGHVVRADLGYSFSQSRPVVDALRETLPYSLLLMSAALVLSVLMGALLGSWQAIRTHSFAARTVGMCINALSAVPEVWLGLVLLAFVSAQLGLLPFSGRCSPASCGSGSLAEQVGDTVSHLVLPVLTLALVHAAFFARAQRVALAEVLHDDVMRTAIAKGAPSTTRYWHHAARRSLRPLLTALGLSLPMLIGGAVFVERVFAWPGMGMMLVNAIAVRDFPLVTACAMIGSVLVVVGAALTDAVGHLLDPRS